MQELYIQRNANLAITSCNVVLHGFENDGWRPKKYKEKRVITLCWDENESIHTKNRVAALSGMASIVFGSLVGQVWSPLSY